MRLGLTRSSSCLAMCVPMRQVLTERHIPLGLWCFLRPNRMPEMISPPKLCAVRLLPDVVVRLQVSERGSRPGKALLQRPPGTTSSTQSTGDRPKTQVMELNSDRPSRAPLTARLAGRGHFRRHRNPHSAAEQLALNTPKLCSSEAEVKVPSGGLHTHSQAHSSFIQWKSSRKHRYPRGRYAIYCVTGSRATS